MSAKECMACGAVFDAFAKSQMLSAADLKWKLQTIPELREYFKTVCTNVALAADL